MATSWKNSLVDFLEARLSELKGGGRVAVVRMGDNGLKGPRNELVVKIVSTTIASLITLGLSIYAIRKLSEVLDPTRKEKQEDQKRLTEYELCMAANLVDTSKMDTDWSDIGGLTNVVEDIRKTIIEPFMHPHLFSSPLSRPPKGVLLYGPPGCGKTMIAKATAKATGARFLNVQISTLFDKWYGESQKRAEAIFSLAKKIQPTIIFIDEIDSFMRERASTDHEATSMMKTQFMTLWDGLSTPSTNTCGDASSSNSDRVVILAATNRPKDVDAAILRRMPSMFHIGLPDKKQRREILKVILRSERVSKAIDWDILLDLTEGWSGSDLKELCRQVVLQKVQEAIHEGGQDEVAMLQMEDFENGMKKMMSFKQVSDNTFRF